MCCVVCFLTPFSVTAAFMDVYSSLGVGTGSVPVGPLGSSPVSPQPPPLLDITPFGYQRPDTRQRWPPDASSFPPRERSSSHLHERERSDSRRRRFLEPEFPEDDMSSNTRPFPDTRRDFSLPERSTSSFQRGGDRSYREEVTSFPRHDPESHYQRRSSGRLSRERDRVGHESEAFGSRRRSRSPEPHFRDRLRPPSLDKRISERIARERGRPADLDGGRHSRSLSNQSHGNRSPPPVHDYHPPERRPRMEEDYFNINEMVGQHFRHTMELQEDYNNPFYDAGKLLPLSGPLSAPLSDRLGGSPAPRAYSVQARLGPPRITEPLDNNHGILPFHAVVKNEDSYPLMDLRQNLGAHSRSTMSLSSESSFPRSISPHLSEGRSSLHLSPVKYPTRRDQSSLRSQSLSPTPQRSLSPQRQSLSPPPSSPRRPTSPPRSPQRYPTLPTGHPQSPTRRSYSPSPPPSPSRYPPSPSRRQHSSPHHPLSPPRHQPSPVRRQTLPQSSPPRHLHSPLPSHSDYSPVTPIRSHSPSPVRRSRSPSSLRRHQSPSGNSKLVKEKRRSRRPSKHESASLSSKGRHKSSPRHTRSPGSRMSGRLGSPSPSGRRSSSGKDVRSRKVSRVETPKTKPLLGHKSSPHRSHSSSSSSKMMEHHSSFTARISSSDKPKRQSSPGHQQPPTSAVDQRGAEKLYSPRNSTHSKTEEQRGSGSTRLQSSFDKEKLNSEQAASVFLERFGEGKSTNRRPPSSPSLAPPVSTCNLSVSADNFGMSHDHHRQSSFTPDNSKKKQTSTTTQPSSLSMSKQKVRTQSVQSKSDKPLFSSTVGIPLSESDRSSSPTTLPFFIDLGSSSVGVEPKSVAQPVSDGSKSSGVPLFPTPLSQSDENTLPFSNFLSSHSPSQRTTNRVSTTPLATESTDSENECGLVIDESFVSPEVTPKKNEEKLTSSKSTDSVLLSSDTLQPIDSHQETPGSPDCQIISVTTVAPAVPSSGRALESTTGDTSSQPLKVVQVKEVLLPSTRRAKNLAATVLDKTLVDELMSIGGVNNNLLKRFYDAIMTIVQCLTWKVYKKSTVDLFVPYFKQAFEGYVTATITTIYCDKWQTLFKDELQALMTRCGTDVSKWKEQITRFVLLVNTLPKKKSDLNDFLLKKGPSLSNSLVAKWKTLLSLAQKKTASSAPHVASLTPSVGLQPHRSSAFTPIITTATSSASSRTKVIPSSFAGPIDSVNQPKCTYTTSCTFQPVLTIPPSDKSAQIDECNAFPLSAKGQSGDYSVNSEPGKAQQKPTTTTKGKCVLSVETTSSQPCDGKAQKTSPSSKTANNVEQGLVGERVSMKVVWSGSAEQMTTDVVKQAKASKEDGSSKTLATSKPLKDTKKLPPVKTSKASEELTPVKPVNILKENSRSKPTATSKLDTVTRASYCSTSESRVVSNKSAATNDLTNAVSCTKEEGDVFRKRSLSPGEIISPSPEPEARTEKKSTSPTVPLAYKNPEKWSRLGSYERELQSFSRRHSQSSSGYRSPSPERSYRRYDRFSSRSRDRVSPPYRSRSRSRDRGRSRRRDHRSRSHDKWSRDWRRYSRSRSKSPRRKFSSYKSRDRRESGSIHRSSEVERRMSKHRKISAESDYELELLKKEALASMKQQQKTGSAQDGDSDGKGCDVDMEICSILSGSGEEMDADKRTALRQGNEEVVEEAEVGGGEPEVGGASIASGNSSVKVSTGSKLVDLEAVHNVNRQKSGAALQVEDHREVSGAESSSVALGGPKTKAQANEIDAQNTSTISSVVESKTEHQQQLPVGRSVSAPTSAPSRDLPRQPKPSPKSSTAVAAVVKRSLTSATATTNQSSVGVASPSGMAILKKTLSQPNSRPSSKVNSPCLSPIHVPSPSGSVESGGGGSERTRQRRESSIKVCVLVMYDVVEQIGEQLWLLRESM